MEQVKLTRKMHKPRIDLVGFGACGKPCDRAIKLDFGSFHPPQAKKKFVISFQCGNRIRMMLSGVWCAAGRVVRPVPTLAKYSRHWRESIIYKSYPGYAELFEDLYVAYFNQQRFHYKQKYVFWANKRVQYSLGCFRSFSKWLLTN